jgi:hypothetical protein
MKRMFKILGVACIAALVVSAVAVASASAAKPQFVLESGAFPVGFTSTSGESILKTTGGTEVVCSADTNTGKILNAKEDEVTVTFTGCHAFGFVACTTGSEPSGTIKTKLLKSFLVYNTAKTKALDLLYPATESFPPAEPPSGGVVAEFSCLGQAVVVRGSVLGQFPTINTFLHSTSLNFVRLASGAQEFEEYVTEAGATRKAFLESKVGTGAFEMAAQSTTDTITLEGTRKVKVEA